MGHLQDDFDTGTHLSSICLNVLRSLGHAVQALDLQDDRWTLPPGTDVVFLALLGTYGEDGTVQERLEDLGIPYTGCGPEASRLAFDKVLTKQRCEAAGVPTAPYVVLDRADAPWPAGWRPPVVVKPVRQGSSVGLRFVERVDFITTPGYLTGPVRGNGPGSLKTRARTG